jgi:hypothetical protein
MTLDINIVAKVVRQKLKLRSFFSIRSLTSDTSNVSCADPCKCFETPHRACPTEARGAKLHETKQAQEPEHLSMRHEECSPRLENGTEHPKKRNNVENSRLATIQYCTVATVGTMSPDTRRPETL